MLDRLIEERIERKRKQSGTTRLPAVLELPRPPLDWDRRQDHEDRKKKEEPRRGVVIIDFM